jgi:glutamine synthetase
VKASKLPKLCSSLDQALDCLEADHQFLLEGNVFSEDIIKSYIQIKREEVELINKITHPAELDLYYSL